MRSTATCLSPKGWLSIPRQAANALIGTWRAISWQQALGEVGAKLRALRAQHGGESIAHWIGAAAGVNVITPLVRGAAFEALGSHAMYGNASLDCTNKFRVCEDMYGSLILESIPLYVLYELSILMAAAWGRPLGELSEEPAAEGSH